MFRILPWAKRSIRVPIEDTAGGQQVRRVRISRLGFKKGSRLLSTFITFYLCYRISEVIVGGSISTKVDNGTASKDQKTVLIGSTTANDIIDERRKKLQAYLSQGNGKLSGKHSIADVQDFIRIPIWFRQRQGPNFLASEPEGKEFIRIQNDEKKRKQLRKDIVRWTTASVKKELSRFPSVTISAVDLKFFPSARPPKWEIPSLYIMRDGSLVPGWFTLPPQDGARLEHILRPTSTFDAAKASIKAFCRVIYVSAVVRWNGGNINDVLHKHASKMQNARAIDEQAKDPNSLAGQSIWPALDQYLKPTDSLADAKSVHYGVLKSIPFSAAVAFASAIFRERQLMALEKYRKKNTQGLMCIRGSVTFTTEIGNLIVHVGADYSPSEDCFVGRPKVTTAIWQYDYRALEKLESAAKQKKQTIAQQLYGISQSQFETSQPDKQLPKPEDASPSNEESKSDKGKD